MKSIESRDEINILVNAFYAKIRKDDLLGPIFNKHIAEEQWPAHLEKLTDFWESQLFRVSKFRGNPTLAHKNVDEAHHHKIEQSHFNHWLSIWFETVDELFEGELALLAKNSAHRMAG
ncbi:MAG: group III truncated hemoglobin, partial [Flavobacteriales bacterium]